MNEFKTRAQKSLTDRIKSYGGTPGRAAGGSMHSDAKQDRTLIDKMVKPSALKRAAGGHVKAPKKPSTAVNIVIAPKGPDSAPIGAGSAAPLVPPRLAPRPAPVPAPMPDGPMPAGPMGAKCGGAIKRASGGKVRRDDGGNVTTVEKTSQTTPPPQTGEYGQYLRARTRPAEPDEKHVYSYPHGDGKKDGGKVRMTAGAASGEGRLEKIDAYGAKAGVRKSK